MVSVCVGERCDGKNKELNFSFYALLGSMLSLDRPAGDATLG